MGETGLIDRKPSHLKNGVREVDGETSLGGMAKRKEIGEKKNLYIFVTVHRGCGNSTGTRDRWEMYSLKSWAPINVRGSYEGSSEKKKVSSRNSEGRGN